MIATEIGLCPDCYLGLVKKLCTEEEQRFLYGPSGKPPTGPPPIGILSAGSGSTVQDRGPECEPRSAREGSNPSGALP